jgi:K(+)-stimulated pyrophosphate-energized sodium pump
MNLVSLLIATSVVKYSSNTGLRVGVALGAVIIIVAAIVYSKRRAHSMGDETPADAEISGATAPAVPAELSPKEAAEVNDVPLGHAPETGALNGHASSPSPQQADKE